MSTLTSTLDTNTQIQFQSALDAQLQQTAARLRPYTVSKPLGKDETYYDSIGTIEAIKYSGSHADIPDMEIQHYRRQWSWESFIIALRVDGNDVERVVTDPTSSYIEECAKAVERQYDRLAVAAMFAAVNTGKAAGTSVSAASDGVITVDATSGITFEKLLEIEQNFINNNVTTDMDRRIALGITGKEHTALMKETELTSGDYSRKFVIDRGRIQSALGMDMVLYAGSYGSQTVALPMIPEITSGTIRDSFCMAEGAICVGIVKEKQVQVFNQDAVKAAPGSKLIKVTFNMGATRKDGKMIQRVQYTV